MLELPVDYFYLERPHASHAVTIYWNFEFSDLKQVDRVSATMNMWGLHPLL